MEKLKTLEIDIPNRKFLLNGKEIAENCVGLSVNYKSGSWDMEMTYKFIHENN